MNNADMPASPVLKGWKSDSRGKAANTGFEVTNYTGGLTKREEFAARAMEGILSSLSENHDLNQEIVVTNSVALADALLAKLEEEQ